MEENIWESNLEDGTLKKEINNLIWTYGHPLMNLEEADKLASNFYYDMEKLCYEVENKRGKVVLTKRAD